MRVEPVTLEGRFARLEPLDRRHAEHLAAEYDPALFAVFGGEKPGPTVEETVRYIDRLRATAHMVPFAAVWTATGQAAGVTCYMDIRPEHRGLEIGSTWYGRAHQGTAMNPECKLLLLRHAFEVLGCERVQLKTDLRNLRSQRAIEKLGAVREGILRRHMVLPDGHVRDTVMYSVIREEWPFVRRTLEERLEALSTQSV